MTMVEEKPKTLSVKLTMDVVESARVVAALRGNVTITDLLSDILRPILARLEEEALERRVTARKPKGKGGPTK